MLDRLVFSSVGFRGTATIAAAYIQWRGNLLAADPGSRRDRQLDLVAG